MHCVALPCNSMHRFVYRIYVYNLLRWPKGFPGGASSLRPLSTVNFTKPLFVRLCKPLLLHKVVIIVIFPQGMAGWRVLVPILLLAAMPLGAQEQVGVPLASWGWCLS